MKYDVFISHASEDKKDVALPLARHLQDRGLKVWLDAFELTLGDSLRRSIDAGLKESRYGVVVLSPAFFTKEWPNKELDGLAAREDGNEKVILPIWHNVGASEIVKYSPMLAGKLAVSTARGLEHTAERVFEAVNRSSNDTTSINSTLGPSESEILETIGQQSLMAKSSRELRESLYELEAHLAMFPHSPQARMLKDRIDSGMNRAEEIECEKASSPMEHRESMAPPRSGLGGFLTVIIWLLIILGVVAGLFYYFS